jgi:hypothetical protein
VRHGVVALALLGAAAGAVVGGAVRPLPAAAAGACPATVPAGQVRVVVVVDPGTEPGAPGPASVDCLVLPEGSTGSDLLRRRAERVGAAPPRYAPSGLLCAIDGYPAPPACGERTSTGYRYWSYWSGTDGRWVYGQGNPFTRRLRDRDVEGWRFVHGAGGPADPPPRITPDPARWFPPVPPPPSPPPPSPPGGGPVPAPPSASAPGSPSPAERGSGPATPPSTGTAAPGDPGGDGSGPAVPSTAEEPSAPDAASPDAEPRAATGDAPGPEDDGAPSALEPVAATGSAGPSPWPAIAGGTLIAALAVVALARFRAGRP